MQALQQWFVWMRTGGRPSRAVRIVGALVEALPQRDRQAIESWLAGSLDRDIAQRLQVPVEFVARVRFDALQEIGLWPSETTATEPKSVRF